MTAYSLVKATQAHVDALVANMRQADRDECAAFGLTPEQSLSKCLGVSRDTIAGLADDEVVALLGTFRSDQYPDIAFVWLQSTTAADRHTKAFARTSKRYVEDLKTKYSRIGNFVDARYEKAVKWIRWLGFEIYPAQPLGPLGVPFHWFEWRA
jgi:hypothetical protein